MSKNIFATITHVAEKITEAITDHKNDEQAHPTLTQQINVLSNESEINLSISTSGETISTRIKNSIAKGKLAGRYRYTSGHSSDAPIPKHAIISYKKTKQSTNTDIMFFADSGEIYTSTLNGSNGEYISDWKQIATTTKTDISLVNQWTKGIGDMNQYVSKNGNTVTVNVSIKGGISDENTVIFTLPDGFKPNSNLVIAGAKNWSKEEVARFITVRTNGEVILRSGFNSSDTYILDFSFSIN